MFRLRDTLDVRVCKQKNTSQNIYMYVQVERYLGYACMQQKYFTKYIFVCLGSKIPWICMYIAKIPQNIYMYVQVARYLGYACILQKYITKICTCLGSKIPHEKKKNKNKQGKEINTQ